MSEPERPQTETRGQPRFITRVGFFIFVGLIVGAVIGGFVYYSPAVGALIGAGVGLTVGLVTDYFGWRARRRAAGQGDEGQDDEGR